MAGDARSSIALIGAIASGSARPSPPPINPDAASRPSKSSSVRFAGSSAWMKSTTPWSTSTGPA